jgi:peptide chain release factor 1
VLPIERLDSLNARYGELEDLLCQPEVIADSARYMKLLRERGELGPLIETYRRYREVEVRIRDDRAALNDPELREVAEEELPELERSLERLDREIALLLVPSDPNDARNTVLEIRAGTGGEEAALFAADLFRMYTRFAERRGWKVEVLSTSASATGGFKEIVALVTGDRVYSVLRFEGGVHRVQRVPETEAQGRIHTSTATVAVLPEADEVDVELRDEDMQITIAAASGPGGQAVNTTNSAVQILHKPTGIIVKCQDERSQIKNRSRAMKVLRARLLDRERQAQHDAEAAERRGMVGTGERAEKIRTYNFPQNRVTDHRLNITLYQLDQFIDGDLDEMTTALRTDHQAKMLLS